MTPGPHATGGGLVASPETFALLRRSSTTIWLRATREPLSALADHTVDTTAAPLHEVVSEVERRTS